MTYRVNQPELAEPDLLARLEALVPNLRARADQTEKLRHVPEESLREIREAGYLHAFRPVYFGGSGLGLSALCNGARILAHGCASTAWTASFLAEHQWLLGKASLPIQEELMGDGRPGLMAGALAKLGTAEPVAAQGNRPAGYIVSARSEWNSAIHHSDWTNFKARLGDVDYMFMVPKSDIVVEDVWHTTGMRGTSSNTIAAQGVFVPERLATPSAAIMGTKAHPAHKDEPFASYPFAPMVSIMCSGTVVGAAEEAVAVFTERLRSRVLAFSGGAKQVDQPVAQMRLGEVVIKMRAARELWDDCIRKLDGFGANGDAITDQQRVDVRTSTGLVVQMCRDVVNDVMNSAGGSAYFLDCPLQRIQRDVEVLKSHAMFDWDRLAQMAGRVQLGLELAPTDLR